MSLLRCENISYRLQIGKEILSDVSVNVEAGKFLVVLGPNGAGKSTLLKLLSGELTPSEGRVIFDSRDMNQKNDPERSKRLGVLSQSSSMTFPYSVFDVVLLGRLPHRKTSSAQLDHEIAWKSLEMVGATHLATQSFPTLSGGEMQRVQLARILAQLDGDSTIPWSEKTLLLDEPTSALDLAHQHQVLNLARQRTNEGMALIAILHDLNLAAQYADDIIMLQNGSIKAFGAPSKVLKPRLINQIYGVEAIVQSHPVLGCPLISTLGERGLLKNP